MLDVAFVLALVAVVGAALSGLWRLVAGPAKSRARLFGRVAIVTLMAFVIGGFGTYRLMNSRTFVVAGELVTRVDTNRKVVALTFDDGPTPEYTEQTLAALAAHNAKATFYLVGAASHANQTQLKEIIAAGHELGNHTYDHERLVFKSGAEVADQFERTDAVFRAAGYDAVTTVRPPNCKKLVVTPWSLARTDRTTITWDLEPDTVAGHDADAMVKYVSDGVQPGSIILMHVMYETGGPMRAALPRILDELSASGYAFVTISELLTLRS